MGPDLGLQSSIAKVKVNFHTKNQGHRSNDLTVSMFTDRHTHREKHGRILWPRPLTREVKMLYHPDVVLSNEHLVFSSLNWHGKTIWCLDGYMFCLPCSFNRDILMQSLESGFSRLIQCFFRQSVPWKFNSNRPFHFLSVIFIFLIKTSTELLMDLNGKRSYQPKCQD